MRLLNDNENVAASRFVWEHYERRCGGSKDAALELTAQATGMGFTIKIRCPNCKATQDITDPSDW